MVLVSTTQLAVILRWRESESESESEGERERNRNRNRNHRPCREKSPLPAHGRHATVRMHNCSRCRRAVVD